MVDERYAPRAQPKAGKARKPASQKRERVRYQKDGRPCLYREKFARKAHLVGKKLVPTPPLQRHGTGNLPGLTPPAQRAPPPRLIVSPACLQSLLQSATRWLRKASRDGLARPAPVLSRAAVPAPLPKRVVLSVLPTAQPKRFSGYVALLDEF